MTSRSMIDDSYEVENAVLQSKLKSKTDALNILKEELIRCQQERDQYKDMLNSMVRWKQDNGSGKYDTLSVIKENSQLKIEVNELNNKVRELFADKKILHRKLCVLQKAVNRKGDKNMSSFPEKDNLLHQLEHLHIKHENLSSDLRAALDEKDELLQERDQYKEKVHRLNHELQIALQGDVSKFCDVDALIMENKFLVEKINQVQKEKELMGQSLLNYENALELSKNKDYVKLSSYLPATVNKQVLQSLETSSSSWLSNREIPPSNLKCLSITLLDALQDKCIALVHQKKTNKLLAERISLLEQQVMQRFIPNDCGNINGCSSPSQLLLRLYDQEQRTNNADSEMCTREEAASSLDNSNRTIAGHSQTTIDTTGSIYGRYLDVSENLSPGARSMFMDVLNSVKNIQPRS